MTTNEIEIGSHSTLKNQIDSHLYRHTALAGAAGGIVGGLGGGILGISAAFAAASLYCAARLYNYVLKSDSRGRPGTECVAVTVASILAAANIAGAMTGLTHILDSNPQRMATAEALAKIADGESPVSATADVKSSVPFQFRQIKTGAVTVTARLTGRDDNEGCEEVIISVPGKPDQTMSILPSGSGKFAVCNR